MKVAPLAQLAFIVLAATSVYMFVSTAHDAETRKACVPLCAMHPSYAGRNRTVPDFELPDLDGRSVRLSRYRGKTIVLSFWTSTCQPCLDEMPSLAELAGVLDQRRDVVLLTVSTDAEPAAIQRTLWSTLRAPPPFEVLVDPQAAVVGGKFGTHLFPETWVIDPHGIIRARFDGARDWASALVLDLVDSIAQPFGCDVEFQAGAPDAWSEEICEDTGSSG